MQLNLSVFVFQLLRSFLRTILFIYFWLHLVFTVARGLFCSHCEQGLLFVAVCGLLGLRSSGCRAGQGTAFRSSHVQAHQLLFSGPRGRPSSCCVWSEQVYSKWDLPGPGIEPVSPALAGGFFTTESLGMPCF